MPAASSAFQSTSIGGPPPMSWTYAMASSSIMFVRFIGGSLLASQPCITAVEGSAAEMILRLLIHSAMKAKQRQSENSEMTVKSLGRRSFIALLGYGGVSVSAGPAVRDGVVNATRPHSGQRSGVPRRSYPQVGQRAN